MVISSFGVSPERKARGVTTVSAVDSMTAIRCRACDCQGSTATFLYRSIASLGLALLDLQDEPIRNWAWPAGSVPGNLPIRVSQAAMASSNFSSVAKLSPIWKRSSGTRASSGFWATNCRQAARASS